MCHVMDGKCREMIDFCKQKILRTARRKTENGTEREEKDDSHSGATNLSEFDTIYFNAKMSQH